MVSGIPLVALAAILIHVGWQITDLRYIRTLYRADRAELAVLVTVATLTVTVDLITAVGVGVVMASLISARELSTHQLAQLHIVSSDEDASPFTTEERELLRQVRGQVLVLHFSGPFSFCSAQDLVRRMGTVGGRWRAAVLDLTDVTLVDASVGMAIREMVGVLTERGTPVYLAGYDRDVSRDLARHEALDQVPPERRVNTRTDGIRQAVALALEGENPPAA
jgi:SulP family sulfate permease